METAIIPCESESDAGAFLPVEMAQPEPPRALEDGQETTGQRPRRERKAPDMEEFDITTVSRARKQRKAPLALDADAEDPPGLPQQSAEQEQDVLQAADADLPAPAADLDVSIRQFMLGEGPKLGVNDIRRLDDTAVSGLVSQMHPALLVNLDDAPEELAAAGLLALAVYEQYKDLTLPLHRYIVDRVIVEWFGRLRPSTKSNYLGAIHRIFGGVVPAAALVLPYDEIAAKVDALIQSSVDSGKMHNPHGSLTVYQGGLARLVAIQLGIPSEQRPVAELTAKHKNDTLAAIEHKCNAGGSSWKLMVQKWKGFAAPSKRVAAVQKGAQTKLITVAELKCGAFSLSRCSDLCTMKYKAIFTKEHPTKPVPCTLLTVKKDGIGKTNNSGEWRSGVVARHKDAHQDAQGWLADLFFYDILVEGVDLVDMALNDQASWQELYLFNPESPRHKPGVGGSWAFETQIVGLLSNQLEVAGLRHLKNRTGHLLRNSGALWASEIVDKEEVALMGEWKQGQGVLLNSYCAKSQSSALRGHLAVAGFSGRESHFLGRSTVQVPPAWLDAVAPGARRALKAFEAAHVGESCKDINHGVRWSLKTLLYLATVWWQNLPVKYERYQGNYTLANIHVIEKIMHSDEYRNFAITILQLEDKSQRLVRGPDVFSEVESPNQAPAALAPPQVAYPRVKEKVKIQLSISFGSCRACVDLWKLWEEERPKLERLSKRNDVIIGPVMQKRRLEAVACTIMRLGEERSGVADGIDALQSIWQELDVLERSLGGKALSLAFFVEGLENIINCTKPETLMSNLKGQGRTKVTKQDLKTILDRHWQLTSAWPSVSYADDSEDLHVPKRFKT